MIEITLLTIQLVYQENYRFTQLFGITKVILCSYFRTILSIQKQDSCICYIQCSNSSSHKIVTTRTINNIQFFAIPFYMIHSREYRVTILLLYREIIADCIFGSDSAATFYDTESDRKSVV